MPKRHRPHLLFALMLVPFWAPAHAADVVVSAASSLTNAFQTIAKAYEAKHPGSKVILNFAASDVLLQQIANGAPADVFASADQPTMDKADSDGLLLKDSRTNFVANRLVLIEPTGTAVELSSLQDLARPDVKRIVLGDPASVPAGRYTRGALEAAGLWQTVSPKAMLAQNVRQSLDYVARDEVDAGFVYATDAAIMPGKVKLVAQVATPMPIDYPIALIAQSKHLADARSFEQFVLSDEGQQLLAKYGFSRP
jgi:molybdate transport system substrate-binding protein